MRRWFRARPYDHTASSRRLAAALVVAVAQCAATGTAWAQDPGAAPAPPPAPSPNFVSLDRLLPAGGIRLANGQSVSKDHWKSIAISRGALTCTASLIGRKVIITSGHCVDTTPAADRPTVRVGTATFGSQTEDVKECTLHPSYQAAASGGRWPRNELDFALCELRVAIAGVEMESVSSRPVSPGTPVILMGFGCSELKIVNGRRIVVTDPPGNEALRLGSQSIEKTGLGYGGGFGGLARTKSDGSQPNVCPGDSGGPVLTGITNLQDARKRALVAVISAFDERWSVVDPEPPEFYSYLAPTTDSIREWIRNWSNGRGLVVCGIQRAPGTDQCRPVE